MTNVCAELVCRISRHFACESFAASNQKTWHTNFVVTKSLCHNLWQPFNTFAPRKSRPTLFFLQNETCCPLWVLYNQGCCKLECLKKWITAVKREIRSHHQLHLKNFTWELFKNRAAIKETTCAMTFHNWCCWKLHCCKTTKVRPTICSHFYRFDKFSNAILVFSLGIAINGGRSARPAQTNFREEKTCLNIGTCCGRNNECFRELQNLCRKICTLSTFPFFARNFPTLLCFVMVAWSMHVRQRTLRKRHFRSLLRVRALGFFSGIEVSLQTQCGIKAFKTNNLSTLPIIVQRLVHRNFLAALGIATNV